MIRFEYDNIFKYERGRERYVNIDIFEMSLKSHLSSYPIDSVYVCMRARALPEVCSDRVLCFVMGYVLQFGEIAHRRVHYYYIYICLHTL